MLNNYPKMFINFSVSFLPHNAILC